MHPYPSRCGFLTAPMDSAQINSKLYYYKCPWEQWVCEYFCQLSELGFSGFKDLRDWMEALGLEPFLQESLLTTRAALSQVPLS